jgi:hypothetical protein
MDWQFWKGEPTIGLGFAAAPLGPAAIVAWFLQRRSKQRLVTHLLRLASDIVSVSGSVDDDLESHAGGGSWKSLSARSRECRETAEVFLAHRERLERLPTIRITRAMEQLHDEHRRIVDLRSEVDIALSSWKRSARLGASRMQTFSSAPQGGGSLTYTHPSTLA